MTFFNLLAIKKHVNKFTHKLTIKLSLYSSQKKKKNCINPFLKQSNDIFK